MTPETKDRKLAEHLADGNGEEAIFATLQQARREARAAAFEEAAQIADEVIPEHPNFTSFTYGVQRATAERIAAALRAQATAAREKK